MRDTIARTVCVAEGHRLTLPAMSNTLGSRRVRHLFFLLASCGLITNLYFDYRALKGASASRSSGEQVAKSYEIMAREQQLDHSLELLALPPLTEQKVQSAHEELLALKSLTADQPKSQQLLTQVESALNKIHIDEIKNVDLLVDAQLRAELATLNQRLAEDRLEHERLSDSLAKALNWDSILILLMIITVFADWYLRSRTERKLLKSLELLRQANSALEDERTKRQVASKAIVHDLKNPLGAIRGFAEIIGTESTDNDAVREFSNTIHRISQNALDLVESLLVKDRSQTQAPVNLNTLMKTVCNQAEGQAFLKSQTLVRELSGGTLPIMGDSHKLEEVVFNLIGNAIKYSPQGASIWIHSERKGKKARIEVVDEGPGFHKSDFAKAFQYGQKLSAQPTGGESSSGLGLFRAKQIIEQHRGSIEIHNCPKRGGARVCVEFPLFEQAKTQVGESLSTI